MMNYLDITNQNFTFTIGNLMFAEKSPEPFAVERGFMVQAFDLDNRGFLKECAIVRWLETLRSNLWRQHFQTHTLTLTTSQINCTAPPQGLSAIQGRSWIANLGETRWTVQSQFHQNYQIIATATQTGYCSNVDILRPMPIPAEISDHFWKCQWAI